MTLQCQLIYEDSLFKNNIETHFPCEAFSWFNHVTLHEFFMSDNVHRPIEKYLLL